MGVLALARFASFGRGRFATREVSVPSENRGCNRDMDVACLISVGILFVLFVLLVQKVSSWERSHVEKIGQECDKAMEKRCKDLSQKMELLEAEWGQVFTKFTRLHSRALRFAQEDRGEHKGGAGRPDPNGPLTRDDVRRIFATGAWRTSSQLPLARPSPE